MRRIDHCGEIADPEHAEVRNRKRAALELLELQFAGPSSRREILGLVGDRRQPLAVGIFDDRRNQPVLECHSHGDVDRVPEEDRLVAPRRVGRRHLPQGQRRRTDHEIVDRDTVSVGFPVELGAEFQQLVDLAVDGQIEMWNCLFCFCKAPGDDAAHRRERPLGVGRIAGQRQHALLG